METVYVIHDGATMRREGERIQVFVRRERKAEFTTHELKQVVVMGNVTLTPAALDLLVSHGIDTVLLSRHGKYRGRVVAGISGNIRLRIAQYRMFTDDRDALDLARRIVDGKLANQRALVLRTARRRGGSSELAASAVALQAARARLDLARTLDEVRGCEGSGSAAYFRAFAAMITAPGFSFSGRNRRPPLDPVNALLSLGYTLLANAVEAAAQVVGLDPFLGTLHAPTAGRPSLVCDLMEEFRAPLVDALVLAALNRGAFKPNDFEDTGDGEPVLLRRETTRWLVTLFERRLTRQVYYAPFRQALPYRNIIEQQARRLARTVLSADTYEPFFPR